MSEAYLSAIAVRRTTHALTSNCAVPDEKLEEIVKTCVLHCPTSFNSQSSRAIIVIGKENAKLWKLITESVLDGLEGDSRARSESRLAKFSAGYGSVMFFEDQTVVDEMCTKFPIYASEFPTWSSNAAGMLQHAVWTSLTLEGLGASLQHYGAYPHILAKIHNAFSLPSSWKSTAIMPFGGPATPPGEKTFGPIEDRFKVLKS